MTIITSIHRRLTVVATGLTAAVALTTSSQLLAQGSDVHPGEDIFASYCATCHEGGDPRAASVATLRTMTADTLRFALTAGLMQAQGQVLSEPQREAVIDYLAVPPVSGE
ncbi:MAG: cytochrome c, partial [Pseudohongiella sp.]